MKVFVCDRCGSTLPNEVVNGATTRYAIPTTAPGGILSMSFKSGEGEHAHLCGKCQLTIWLDNEGEQLDESK